MTLSRNLGLSDKLALASCRCETRRIAAGRPGALGNPPLFRWSDQEMEADARVAPTSIGSSLTLIMWTSRWLSGKGRA